MKLAQRISALAVAEYFVSKAKQEGNPITNKKIQKLAYYAQAWSLTLHNKTLFDEKIEAWVHGPVVRSIYDAYKQYGFTPIQKSVDAALIESIPEDCLEVLDEVWRIYGKLDSSYLEMLTHQESPWQDARAGLEASDNSEAEITAESMRKFYLQKLEKLAK